MSRKKKIENKAYTYIKAQISEANWTEGRQIKELEVADALAVSRTPVRTALKRLESEGYVTTLPNKGVYVAEKPLELKQRKERIYFLEALLQHILYTLQLDETIILIDPLNENIKELEEAEKSDSSTFEKIEIDYWKYIFNYHSNTYMNDVVIQTMVSLYQNKKTTPDIFEKSRAIKVSHYKKICQWLDEKNYVYARREVRILLNQLLVNLIQGVDE